MVDSRLGCLVIQRYHTTGVIPTKLGVNLEGISMAKGECKDIPNFILFNGIQQNPALNSKFIKSSFQ